MVEMGERSIVVGVARVVAPFPFVPLTFLIVKLYIFLNDGIWGSFSVIKVSEGPVVV